MWARDFLSSGGSGEVAREEGRGIMMRKPREHSDSGTAKSSNQSVLNGNCASLAASFDSSASPCIEELSLHFYFAEYNGIIYTTRTLPIVVFTHVWRSMEPPSYVNDPKYSPHSTPPHTVLCPQRAVLCSRRKVSRRWCLIWAIPATPSVSTETPLCWQRQAGEVGPTPSHSQSPCSLRPDQIVSGVMSVYTC